MKHVAVGAIGLALLAAGPAPAEVGNPVLRQLLHHSDVALMPEWWFGNAADFAPLHPALVVWGEDPAYSLEGLAGVRGRTAHFHDHGIPLVATNLEMLTANARWLHERPELQDAVCVDIAGGRIIPPWARETYEGTPTWWGCTNHPLFRQMLRQRLVDGLQAGANLVHLDDHAGSSATEYLGGCLCDHCVAGFRGWLRAHSGADELHRRGVADPETFDYRVLLRQAGYTTREAFVRDRWTGKVPLFIDFVLFQRDAATGFVRELADLAAQTAGRPVPVGTNAYNLSPPQLLDAHLADYFANEVQHVGREDTLPPLVYQLGEALGKPVFATATGEDWSAVSAAKSVVRVRLWIAQAYAFGQYFMYAQRKWCFTPEAGTHWYDTPIATYEPLTTFIDANARLFDGCEAVAQVGVLYSSRACDENHWEVREACRALRDAGVPNALVVAGDRTLRHELTDAELGRHPLIVAPQPDRLVGVQAARLAARREAGQVVDWTDATAVLARIRPWVRIEGAERVWALPRRVPGDPSAPLVVHLLNRDYDAVADAMRPRPAFRLHLAGELFPAGRPSRAVLHTPGMADRSLPVHDSPAGVTVTVPGLELWSVVELARS
ncbi:MAG: hypothetical protein HYU66_29280 [Armatimonadetes bacterium]|nr:hypothetical protein [Armatimonadota bacterium]